MKKYALRALMPLLLLLLSAGCSLSQSSVTVEPHASLDVSDYNRYSFVCNEKYIVASSPKGEHPLFAEDTIFHVIDRQSHTERTVLLPGVSPLGQIALRDNCFYYMDCQWNADAPAARDQILLKYDCDTLQATEVFREQLPGVPVGPISMDADWLIWELRTDKTVQLYGYSFTDGTNHLLNEWDSTVSVLTYPRAYAGCCAVSEQTGDGWTTRLYRIADGEVAFEAFSLLYPYDISFNERWIALTEAEVFDKPGSVLFGVNTYSLNLRLWDRTTGEELTLKAMGEGSFTGCSTYLHDDWLYTCRDATDQYGALVRCHLPDGETELLLENTAIRFDAPTGHNGFVVLTKGENGTRYPVVVFPKD